MKLSRIPFRFSRRAVTMAATIGAATALAVSAAAAATAGASNPQVHASPGRPFVFRMVPSPGIANCLPHAGGTVAIFPHKLNDTMVVSIHGMPAHSGFDLFVIQEPNKPFGLSWYQTDIEANGQGVGSATVQGIFDSETFTVSLPNSPTASFDPASQFHLGLWFDNPDTPQRLGCTTVRTETPFNGEHHAGIQVLNTANFGDSPAAGPLAHVHR
jgi:hypothetical protein